jgi:riboflavin kinase/FMN adenylyltransferase
MTLQVWRSLADVPASAVPSVVTIGNFDGVHRGHQAVLERMVADARERNHVALAVTFEPHPKAVHDPAHPPELITGLEDRLERLGATGLDGVLVVDYTLEFAQLTPHDFVRDYLVEGLGLSLGFEVEVVDDAGVTAASGRRWSSTWVRELLEAGDMPGAAEVLGREHRLRGRIVGGDKIGRVIGFPTANIDVAAGMIPRHGVYAGWLTVVDAGDNNLATAVMGERMPAAVSVGLNYTVGGTDLRVEAFVIDRTGLDVYGATATLDLVQWRRPMLDFGSIEALTEALAEDVAWCESVLNPH